MEAPDWVASILTWLTAVTFSLILFTSIVKERPRLRKVRQQRPPRRLSRAYLSYFTRSAATNWRRFFEVMWSSAKSTADLGGRVGVLVIAAVVLYFGISLPATVPDWEWLWGLPAAIVGTGVICAAIISRVKNPTDDGSGEG